MAIYRGRFQVEIQLSCVAWNETCCMRGSMKLTFAPESRPLASPSVALFTHRAFESWECVDGYACALQVPGEKDLVLDPDLITRLNHFTTATFLKVFFLERLVTSLYSTVAPCSAIVNTVKEEIFVGEKFRTFPSQTFRMEFNFVLSNWPKKVKTRSGDRKACKLGGRKFGMEINFVHFSIIQKLRN